MKNLQTKLKKKRRRIKRMNNRKRTEKTESEETPKNVKLINEMVFKFYEKTGVGGQKFVSVSGIPVNLKVAIHQMNSAVEAIVKLFVDKALEGNLDQNYSINQVEMPQIKPPIPGILVRDNRLVSPSGIVIPDSNDNEDGKVS